MIQFDSHGPWHDTADHDPVHKGYYDCCVTSTVCPKQRLWWNGNDWIMDNGVHMRLHVSHWRGLNHPPIIVDPAAIVCDHLFHNDVSNQNHF